VRFIVMFFKNFLVKRKWLRLVENGVEMVEKVLVATKVSGQKVTLRSRLSWIGLSFKKEIRKKK